MRLAVAPLTALVTVAALALAPACGFPTLSYEDAVDSSSGGMPDGTSHSDGSSGDTGADGTSSADGEPGGDASSDVASDTAQGVGDGSMDSASHDSSMPHFDSGDPCDVDGDGYKAMGGTCGGDDCCDIDPAANPGVSATSWFTSPDACGNFNYRCQSIAMEYIENLTCSGDLALGCTPVNDGFTATIACGSMGLLQHCTPSGALSCAPSPVSMAYQGCN